MPPPYAIRDLPASPDRRSDERVQGGGPFWSLRLIQEAIRNETLEILLTSKAGDELNELGWDFDDLEGFLLALHAGPCRRTASQWCLEPEQHPPEVPDGRLLRLGDVYVMGYQRLRRTEQANAHPKIYLKFTIIEPHTMLIYSIHHERE